jgi:hypothetical protein
MGFVNLDDIICKRFFSMKANWKIIKDNQKTFSSVRLEMTHRNNDINVDFFLG